MAGEENDGKNKLYHVCTGSSYTFFIHVDENTPQMNEAMRNEMEDLPQSSVCRLLL